MGSRKSVKGRAKSNPTILGDPVSLEAETLDISPSAASKGFKKDSLKNIATDKLKEANPSMLGDPVSLKAETSDTKTDPTGDDGMGGVTGNKERDSKL